MKLDRASISIKFSPSFRSSHPAILNLIAYCVTSGAFNEDSSSQQCFISLRFDGVLEDLRFLVRKQEVQKGGTVGDRDELLPFSNAFHESFLLLHDLRSIAWKHALLSTLTDSSWLFCIIVC